MTEAFLPCSRLTIGDEEMAAAGQLVRTLKTFMGTGFEQCKGDLVVTVDGLTSTSSDQVLS
ncbi:hypothetical protein EJA72_00910 [Pseudomonas sp. PB120]|uniref:hypothetical protein n=1 Tax=Pseudomonas sp. PB120 TaxID=2494700 RepID=UPI0012FD15E7|nr:hypothetical protein [Pseudomonas sp. PB120]MVV46824.1 hypothetical protein [Pseudomonas sp. PB120]